MADISTAPVSLPLIPSMQILTWNGTGYVYSSYDPGFNGWIDANFASKAAPSYSIGQGFFFFNPAAAAQWKQSLP